MQSHLVTNDSKLHCLSNPPPPYSPREREDDGDEEADGSRSARAGSVLSSASPAVSHQKQGHPNL